MGETGESSTSVNRISRRAPDVETEAEINGVDSGTEVNGVEASATSEGTSEAKNWERLKRFLPEIAKVPWAHDGDFPHIVQLTNAMEKFHEIVGLPSPELASEGVALLQGIFGLLGDTWQAPGELRCILYERLLQLVFCGSGRLRPGRDIDEILATGPNIDEFLDHIFSSVVKDDLEVRKLLVRLLHYAEQDCEIIDMKLEGNLSEAAAWTDKSIAFYRTHELRKVADLVSANDLRGAEKVFLDLVNDHCLNQEYVHLSNCGIKYRNRVTLFQHMYQIVGIRELVKRNTTDDFIERLFEHFNQNYPSERWITELPEFRRWVTETCHTAGIPFRYWMKAICCLWVDIFYIIVTEKKELKTDDLLININKTCQFCKFFPLHRAVRDNSPKIVEELLKFPNLIRAHEESHELQGLTPLEWSIKMGYKQVEKCLLRAPEVEKAVEKLFRDRQILVEAGNSILVGAALIASVTFAGWLQPPLNYIDNYQFPIPASSAPSSNIETVYEKYMGVEEHPTIRIFAVTNCLSFFFAMATVLAGADMAFFVEDVYIGKTVRSMQRSLKWTISFLIISVVNVLIAFSSAAIAVLPPLKKYTTGMYISIAVGAIACWGMITKILLFRLCSYPRQIVEEWKDKRRAKMLGKRKEKEKVRMERNQTFKTIFN